MIRKNKWNRFNLIGKRLSFTSIALFFSCISLSSLISLSFSLPIPTRIVRARCILFRYLNLYWLHMIYRSHLHSRKDSSGYSHTISFVKFVSVVHCCSTILFLFLLSVFFAVLLRVILLLLLFCAYRLWLMILKPHLKPIWINHFDILRRAICAMAVGQGVYVWVWIYMVKRLS